MEDSKVEKKLSPIAIATGERIRMAREEKGLTQKQLAEKVGVEPPTVSRWESGEMRARPSNIIVIANFLGKEPAWFLHPHVQGASWAEGMKESIMHDARLLVRSEVEAQLNKKQLSITIQGIVDILTTLNENQLEVAFRQIKGIASGSSSENNRGQIKKQKGLR